MQIQRINLVNFQGGNSTKPVIQAANEATREVANEAAGKVAKQVVADGGYSSPFAPTNVNAMLEAETSARELVARLQQLADEARKAVDKFFVRQDRNMSNKEFEAVQANAARYKDNIKAAEDMAKFERERDEAKNFFGDGRPTEV